MGLEEDARELIRSEALNLSARVTAEAAWTLQTKSTLEPVIDEYVDALVRVEKDPLEVLEPAKRSWPLRQYEDCTSCATLEIFEDSWEWVEEPHHHNNFGPVGVDLIRRDFARDLAFRIAAAAEREPLTAVGLIAARAMEGAIGDEARSRAFDAVVSHVGSQLPRVPAAKKVRGGSGWLLLIPSANFIGVHISRWGRVKSSTRTGEKVAPSALVKQADRWLSGDTGNIRPW